MNLYCFPFKAMGSPCELRLYAHDPEKSEYVANLVVDEIRRLEKKYSRYQTDSVTTSINHNAGNNESVVIDHETATLLNYVDVGFQ